MPWFLSFLGLFLLLISGDFLVKGAIQLSNRLGVSALLVSLTVVAFGTSAPELIVAIKATLSGSPGLAMGNVVGSNIANILLVLGLPTLLVRLQNGITDTKRSFVLMILASVLFIVFGMILGVWFFRKGKIYPLINNQTHNINSYDNPIYDADMETAISGEGIYTDVPVNPTQVESFNEDGYLDVAPDISNGVTTFYNDGMESPEIINSNIESDL